MSAERESDTAYSEVETWIDISFIVGSYFHIVESVEKRETFIVGTESVYEVLACEEEVVAATEEVTLGIGGIEEVAPVDVSIVVGCRELDSHDRLLAIVELDFRHIEEVVIQFIFATVDNIVAVFDNISPVACEGGNLSHESGSHIFAETPFFCLRFGK